MKKQLKEFVLLILAIIVLSVCLLSMGGCEDTEGLIFTLNEDGQSYGVAAKYPIEETIFEIPSHYKNKPVTKIAEEGFKGSLFTEIILPDTLEVIGESAFWICGNLKSITIPASVKIIEKYAFSTCIGIDSVYFEPDSQIKSIGESAFSATNILIVTLPETLESLTLSAFSACDNLRALNIPANTKLTDVVFDSDRETDENGNYTDTKSLMLCERFEKFTVSRGNPYYKAVDGVLFSADGKILIKYPDAKAGKHYKIPEGVETIAFTAIVYPKNLEVVEFPTSLKSIETLGCFPDIGKKTILIFNSLTPANIYEGSILSEKIEKIFVPAQAVEAYKNALGWQDFADKIFAVEE